MRQEISLPESSAEQWTLPNGLEVIIKEDPKAPVASLQAWCRAGSIHEAEWTGAGLSHILEHMLFKGTARRRGPEIATTVQDSGGYINAYTSFDRTVFWIDTPADGVEVCLDVLMDVMMNATIPEEEFAREQEVIRREFAMGYDDPDRMSSQLLFRTAYSAHPCRHPVIGYMDVFNRLTRGDVLAYYHRHYVPNNIFFVIVGDVNAQTVKAQLETFFADHPRKAYEPVIVPHEPEQLSAREAHIEFETQLTRAHWAWGIPDVRHPDIPALDVLAAILGQGRSSRLFREIRDKQGLAHAIGAFAYSPSHRGIFAISATADADKRKSLEDALLRLIADLQRDGVSEDEMAKARKCCLVDLLNDLTSMRGQANDLANSWIVASSLDYTRDYLRVIREVTEEDVVRMARQYLRDDRRTSVSLNPKGTLTQLRSKALNLGKPKTIKVTLENGATLLMRRDRQLPLVSMRATCLAGLLAEDEANNGLTKLCSRVLIKGTQSRSADEIVGLIENAGGSIAASAGTNTLGVSLNLLADDVALGIALLSDVWQNPAFPVDEIERERLVQLAAIRAEEDHLISVGARHLRKRLFQDHPYSGSREGTEISVNQLTKEQIDNFHRSYFVGGNTVLAVYGDIDPPEVERLIRAQFDSLPEGPRPFQGEEPPLAPYESTIDSLYRDKAQAVLLMGFPGVGARSKDRLALEIIEEACSDLSSRLFMRIREEMGLAYYVSAGQMIGLEQGLFYYYLGTDPQKLDEVQAVLRDEVAKIAKDGLTEEEFERARKTYLGKLALEKQTNGAVAMLDSLDELYGMGLGHHEALLSAVSVLTRNEVKAVSSRYFGEAQPIIVRVLPPLQVE